ncbi:hypothetical protein [Pyxidicoccus caerfyrddinensis]|uniref:hypothetical protein n=1 Tax=Pyxidicoccus caerfyrddinensis TaxID=2709663 RepID=UPI0013D997DA|nr:hypothetical protein [Pyxidicoccus caerfyrddinensis]
MSEASHSIVIICEGPADHRTAPAIADRVLSSSAEWLVPEMLHAFREWRGLKRHEPFLAWKQVHTLARAANIRINGFFNGEPGAPDAYAARQALALLKVAGEDPIDAVILLRDSDNDEERKRGLEQARAEVSNPSSPLLIGVAHTKRECWVLAGFNPLDERERAQLDALKQELGFDPCLCAEELTAQQDGAKRDAKRVLSVLTGNSIDREATCWKECAFQQLEARGQNTGLAAFIQEIRTKLVPLWTGRTL